MITSALRCPYICLGEAVLSMITLVKSSYKPSAVKNMVREKSRVCHNHKPQPFPDPKRKRKPTNPNKHKSNKRTKSTKISSLFPKRGNLLINDLVKSTIHDNICCKISL